MLRDRGADGVDHPGGTLGAHLERVEQRLTALGLSRTVALAGRGHAVYGTDGFDVRLLGEHERPLDAGQERDLANLGLDEIDVAEQAPGFLERHGEYFRRLTDAWRPVLSTAVATQARAAFEG